MEKHFYILAIRDSASILGGASAIAKINGKAAFFATREEAQAQADQWTYAANSNKVRFVVRED